jgi:hypothetical protein
LGFPALQVISVPDDVVTHVDVAQLLGPPPPAARSEPSPAGTSDAQPATFPVFAQESFQVISGMYDLAESSALGLLGVELFVVDQYVDQLLRSLKSVPPTATLNGVEASPSTARPEIAAG